MWARGFECAWAVCSLVCAPSFVLERGVRVPALMSWVSVSCRGLDTRAPCSVLLWERVVSSTLGSALSYPRVLCCFTQFMFFIGCLHSCYVLCCVAHSLCFALAVFIVVIVFLFSHWFYYYFLCLLHFLLCKALWITTVYEMCHINKLALKVPVALLRHYWAFSSPGLLDRQFLIFILKIYDRFHMGFR